MQSRGTQGLAVRYRPQTFSEMVGHEKLIAAIRKHWDSEEKPTAWMFSGPTGSGKTTLARIMAVSVNCTHAGVFGEPCEDCRKRKRLFDILERNASSMTGVDATREMAETSAYLPTPPSRYRVYILDEAQRLSPNAQDLLLKPFEDGPKTTLWVICTTDPRKILRTLQRRCIHYHLASFRPGKVDELVHKVIESESSWGRLVGEEIPKNGTVDQFIARLHEKEISTPGLVMVNLEKFLRTLDPDVVIQTEGEAEGAQDIGSKVYYGDWKAVKQICTSLSPQEALGLRSAVASYLRVILLKEPMSELTDKIVLSIKELGAVQTGDEGFIPTQLLATLYTVCKRFKSR